MQWINTKLVKYLGTVIEHLQAFKKELKVNSVYKDYKNLHCNFNYD